MLVNLDQVLQPAFDGGYAVACFNVFGYEDALAVVETAEARGASVILSINLDMVEFMPLRNIVSMFRPLAESAGVPVCLHLDHNYDIDTVKRAIDHGFTSVMFDGSQKPIADNIAGIQSVAAHARKRNASVEAEVGSVPYATGRDYIKSALTDVNEALMMVEQGRPQALAISVGNIHRVESSYVDINFERFEELEKAVEIPLVIHGTSGIKPEDIRALARRRVCKFNIGTCLRQRFGSALRKTLEADRQLFDRLTIMKRVVPEIRDEVGKMIELLGQ
jgi:fructose-bisphosphate aldolase class II